MMANVGEEIAGQYLRIECGCDFVQYNVYTKEAQGEIDVLAVNFHERKVYLCEVAVHLTTGLLYAAAGKTDTFERFVKKFNRNIDYAEKAFADFTRHYMLWSPIVRSSRPGVKYDQYKVVGEIVERIRRQRNVDIELMINEDFSTAMGKLRAHAAKSTEELKSPLMRLMQIEAYLAKHLARRKKTRTT